MLSFKFTCPGPNCGAVLNIPEDCLGQKVRCAWCGHAFNVPKSIESTSLVQTKLKLRKYRKAG